MKNLVPRLIKMAIILMIIAGCTNPLTEEVEKLKLENAALIEMIAPLPASLDKLYPPEAEAPVLLFEMFKLSEPMAGIGIDLFENDFENALAHYENFKAQFIAISKLVPEWEDKFDIASVVELGNAMDSQDQEKIMHAFEGIAKVCHDCHMNYMSQVQLKYHWEDFGEIVAVDPFTKDVLPYTMFKHNLSTAFSGIGINLQEGQIENARKNFEAFNSQFQVLKDVCGDCHQSDRKYYVDEGIQAMIDKLGETLQASEVDMEMVGNLSQGIGMESCFQCHLVHMAAPSAKFKRDSWEKFLAGKETGE